MKKKYILIMLVIMLIFLCGCQIENETQNQVTITPRFLYGNSEITLKALSIIGGQVKTSIYFTIEITNKESFPTEITVVDDDATYNTRAKHGEVGINDNNAWSGSVISKTLSLGAKGTGILTSNSISTMPYESSIETIFTICLKSKMEYPPDSGTYVENIRCFDSTPILIESSESWCYQETANISSVCGGLDTGKYACSGTWISTYPCNQTIDENWNTYGTGSVGHLYINYTKPIGALNSSLWQVKDEALRNITIPQSCWDYNNDLLMFQVYANSGGGFTKWYCYNTNNNWNQIGVDDNNIIYEEAMWWKTST